MAFLPRILATSFLTWTVLSAAVKEPLQARTLPEPRCGKEFGYPVLAACMLAYRDNMVVRNGDTSVVRVFRVSATPLTNNDVWTPQVYQHFKLRSCSIEVFNSPILFQPETSTFEPLQEAVQRIILICVARQGIGGYVGGLGRNGNLAVFVSWFQDTDKMDAEWGPPGNVVTNPSYEDPKHDDDCEGSAGRKDVTGKLSKGSGSGAGASGGTGTSGYTYGTARTPTPDSISLCPGFQTPAQCIVLEAPKVAALDALLRSSQGSDMDLKLDPQTGYCRDTSACCSGYQCVKQAVRSLPIMFGWSGPESFMAGICQIAQGTFESIYFTNLEHERAMRAIFTISLLGATDVTECGSLYRVHIYDRGASITKKGVHFQHHLKQRKASFPPELESKYEQILRQSHPLPSPPPPPPPPPGLLEINKRAKPPLNPSSRAFTKNIYISTQEIIATKVNETSTNPRQPSPTTQHPFHPQDSVSTSPPLSLY
ncbi:MAG: hypothetical protein M1836_002361 [Candelina mexicana]|nr:MAG: hypothetical protein M1836_002361 [Candelina mexicana]